MRTGLWMVVGVVALLGTVALAQEEPPAEHVALMQNAGAQALQQAAEAHDDDGIAAAARGAMFGGCQACHTAHREEKPGGGYLIK